MNPRIEILPALKDNFIYVLVKGGECAVIDPGEALPVQTYMAQNHLRLTHILCTHHHWDHISGIPDLLSAGHAEVWCSPADLSRIQGATKAVTGIETLWEEPVEILSVPGHTLGQIAYYFPRLKALFPGDTLFSAGCGRLFEGTAEQMFISMQKIRALPEETQIYFGHEYTLRNLEFVEKYKAAPLDALAKYRSVCERRLSLGLPTAPSSLAEEMIINPFLNAKDLQQFSKWRELRNNW